MVFDLQNRYPLSCIRLQPVQRFPRVDLQGVLCSFMSDVRSRLRSVCGFAAQLSGKPCYHTVNLSTAASMQVNAHTHVHTHTHSPLHAQTLTYTQTHTFRTTQSSITCSIFFKSSSLFSSRICQFELLFFLSTSLVPVFCSLPSCWEMSIFQSALQRLLSGQRLFWDLTHEGRKHRFFSLDDHSKNSWMKGCCRAVISRQSTAARLKPFLWAPRGAPRKSAGKIKVVPHLQMKKPLSRRAQGPRSGAEIFMEFRWTHFFARSSFKADLKAPVSSWRLSEPIQPLFSASFSKSEYIQWRLQ